jgi:hypothetical protein
MVFAVVVFFTKSAVKPTQRYKNGAEILSTKSNFMKNLLLLFVAVMAVACSKPESEPAPDPNAPTTFVFVHNFDDIVFPNCVAGYYADDLCHKIADLGDMTKGKQTPEITLTNDDITEIRLFADYPRSVVLRRSFPIKKNIKNVFEIREDDYSDKVDKDDPAQYPH